MANRADASISIQGHSGSQVRVAHGGDRVTVVKSAEGAAAADRLRLQIAKQRQARDVNSLGFVRIPEVLGERLTAEGYEAEMEYVFFRDPIDFFNAASSTGVERVGAMLVAFVDAQLDLCRTTQVPTALIHDKLDSIERAVQGSTYDGTYCEHIEWVRRRLGDSTALELPSGSCHGDLTMSNVLIAHDVSAIALVDFLDSFIESPLIDITKIRQDTRFGWTALMATRPVDRVRYRQIMAHLDRLVDEAFRSRPWYVDHFEAMMAVTLLRVAPYARSSAVHDFLTDSLGQLRN